jgi:hypothetical protein
MYEKKNVIKKLTIFCYFFSEDSPQCFFARVRPRMDIQD